MRLSRLVAMAALFCATATGALAQDAPNPFETVPADRSAAAPAADSTDRVFGGTGVKPGQYPFQVALLRTSDLTDDPQSQYGAEFCGGTLVAPNWVLTAAHCVVDTDKTLGPADVTVLTGSTDLMAGQRVTPKAIFVDDTYDQRTLDHDAALIELSTAVSAPPVALDFSGDTITPTTNITSAVVLGWGMNENGDYPRYLLQSDLDVVANADCNVGIKSIYSTELRAAVRSLGDEYFVNADVADQIGTEMAQKIADPLSASMLCAGLKSGERDACYGDSGGPLIAMIDGKPTELGIVSWGEGPATDKVKCGHADVYGVYSRVASFKDWIQSHLQTQ